jgi:hypothetical protein
MRYPKVISEKNTEYPVQIEEECQYFLKASLDMKTVENFEEVDGIL